VHAVFAAFQRMIAARLDGPPVPHEAAVIGSYRYLEATPTR
jgi:hypothetical protein